MARQIMARMVAAKKERDRLQGEIKSLGAEAKKRHDAIAAGDGKLKETSREAALEALSATSDFCREAARQ